MALPREVAAPQAARVTQQTNEHPGWGASIETLFALMRQAEGGDPRLMCQMFDDVVRRDAALRGYISARRSAISGKPVLILPGGPDREDRKAADRFRDIWSRIDTQDILEEHAQGPNFYGWAASEIEWQWVRDDRLYNPVGFFTPRAETFRVAVEFDPYAPGTRPDELLVRVGYYPHEVARMIPGKWVVTPRTVVERRVWDGLMVTSAIYSILKTQGYANWFLFLKRYGIPFLKVSVHSFTDPESKATALEIVRRFGEDGGIIVPKSGGVEVEVIDAAEMSRNASSDPQARFTDECNLENSKLWTGGTLTSETGKGSSSYALAKEHGGVRHDLLREDAQRIQSSWERQIIRPWMRFNNIPGRPPRVKLFLTRVDDPAQAVVIANGLSELGIQVDADHLLELTGMRGERVDDGKEKQENHDADEQ